MAVALENELSFLRKKIRTNRWCTVGTIDCHISGVVLVTGNTVLPLPSREDASSDPEIAVAEEKLWKAFDAALAEYSAEILAIQARRRLEDEGE